MAELNLSEAIREALAHPSVSGLAEGAGGGKAVKAYLTSHHPHLIEKLGTPTFSATLSTMKKKLAATPAATHDFDDNLFPPQQAPQQAPGQPQAVQPTGQPQQAQEQPKPLPITEKDMLLFFLDALDDVRRLAQKVGGKEVLMKLVERI